MRKHLLALLLLLCIAQNGGAWAQQQTTTPSAPQATPAASTEQPSTSKNLVTLPSDDTWYTTCWICPLLQLAEDVRQDYGKRAFTMIGGQLRDIVLVVTVLWLLVQVAKLFSPFGGGQSSKILNGIIKQILLTLIIMMLIFNYKYFWNLLNLVVEGGTYTGQVVLLTATEAIPPGMFRLDCSPPPAAPGSEEVDAMQTLLCQVEVIQHALGIGVKLGFDLQSDTSNLNYMDKTIGGGGKSLLRFIAGIALIGVFGYNLIAFPFRIIDLMIRLTILTVLAPIFIASFLFPFSRNLTFLALRMLFASGMTVVMTSVVVAAYIIGLAAVLDMNGAKSLETLKLQDGIVSGAFWHLLTLGLLTNTLMAMAPRWADAAVSVPINIRLPMYGSKVLENVSGTLSRNFSRLLPCIALGIMLCAQPAFAQNAPQNTTTTPTTQNNTTTPTTAANTPKTAAPKAATPSSPPLSTELSKLSKEELAAKLTKVEDMSQICIGCVLVSRMIEITDTYGKKVFKTLQNGMLGLIAVGTTLWILFHVGRLFTPFTPLAELTNLNNMVTNRLGITLLVCLFLGSFLNFWNIIYTPIVVSGLQSAGVFINAASEVAGMEGAVTKFCGGLDLSGADGAVLSKAMECVMGSMQETVGKIMMGALSGMYASIGILNPFTFIVGIAGCAIILWQFGWIYLSLPLRIADIVIRWTVISMLSPIIIAAFILPSARNLTITALRGLVQSSMELLMVGVVLALTNGTIVQLEKNAAAAQNFDPSSPGEAVVKYFSQISLGVDLFWQLFIIGMVTNLLLRNVNKYSDALINPGSHNSNIDTSIGSGIADAAQAIPQNRLASMVQQFTNRR